MHKQPNEKSMLKNEDMLPHSRVCELLEVSRTLVLWLQYKRMR